MSDTTDATGSQQALGKITLGRKTVSENEFDRHGDAAIRRRDPKEVGRLNKLVPYLDLFARLEDHELAQLADVPERTVARMRVQVKSVQRKLGPYVGLLDRLDDRQLGRIAQTSPKMFLYLRLCQPRGPNVTLKMPSRVPRFVSISSERAEADADGEDTDMEGASPVPSSEVAIGEESSREESSSESGDESFDAEFEFSFVDDDDE